MIGDPKAQDPLFAVAIVARRRDGQDADGNSIEYSTLKLSLELIREATAYTARTLGVEQFEREHPDYRVLGHVVEPVP